MRKPVHGDVWRYRNKKCGILFKYFPSNYNECYALAKKLNSTVDGHMYIHSYDDKGLCNKTHGHTEWDLFKYIGNIFTESEIGKTKTGYHLTTFVKGIYGEISKIKEEIYELEDAHEQKNKIMELVELSDIICAIKGYLKKEHSNIKLEDLITMAEATERAFNSGERK